MIVSLNICVYVTGEGTDGSITTRCELGTCKMSSLCCWDLDSRYVLPVMECGVCPGVTRVTRVDA